MAQVNGREVATVVAWINSQTPEFRAGEHPCRDLSVRRRTTQALRGRRGRACDPEWTSRRRLLRGVERLTDNGKKMFAKRVSTPRPPAPPLRGCLLTDRAPTGCRRLELLMRCRARAG